MDVGAGGHRAASELLLCGEIGDTVAVGAVGLGVLSASAFCAGITKAASADSARASVCGCEAGALFTSIKPSAFAESRLSGAFNAFSVSLVALAVEFTAVCGLAAAWAA
ncbi:hypothetical protein CEW81_09380 [Kluyvera genomosp. 3]|uniref:Uncharacterized protein n=1 Tax=Kluyvera genomosp. 3 TaxID=2774055 RepID=A0A248KI34_9ENTR|nr:hypothetical protein CEW81_09380 [Kluyvera genomosp. 3]